MLASCGGETAAARIDGHWRVFPKVLDDTCALGFASRLDVLDIDGAALVSSGRRVRLEADGDTWRSSSRVANPPPCPQRDGFEAWEVRGTAKGLVGTYEALFAAGGTCEPICLVRVAFTGIHRDDPASDDPAAAGPIGTWRSMPLLSSSALANASEPPRQGPVDGFPPPSGITGPLGLLPPDAPRIPGLGSNPCPALLPGMPEPPPQPVPEAP